MYLVKIEVRKSDIDGNGVFALQKISKGVLVWKYDPLHDNSISVDDYNHSNQEIKDELDRVAYLSPTSGMYVFPSDGDPARFTNHSNKNNLSVFLNDSVSSEPYFVANRDIEIGEEITNNYKEFDDALKSYKPNWI